MIPEFLKNRIELKFGRAIKYPKDCVALAIEINKLCNEKISQTTLLRFFALINEPCNPRLHTLDVIAVYAGFECWRDVIDEDYLSRARPKFMRVKISSLEIGSNLSITFGESTITAEYIGSSQFLIAEALNCSLEAKDKVNIMRLEYGYPFVCESVERSGRDLGVFASIAEDVIKSALVTK
ncbi:MAG: hypothetical protein EBX50_14500 [Chitinophagia bacterium]|nr:hypothetical protein [Chitinophagia bacterium]